MKISRTGVQLFSECPHCFYLQYKLKMRRPSGYPFTLNAAVDKLVKVEMDYYRDKQMIPPMVAKYGYDLIPYKHEQIDTWRNNFRGVSHEYGGHLFYGAIDDVWIDEDEMVHVVDYKCTAKADPVTGLDENAEHHKIYKKQVEFYTWLLMKNGIPMSEEAFFYYSTGDNTKDMFEDKLEFRTYVIPHTCDLSWIEPTLDELIEMVESDDVPESGSDCKYCIYHHNRMSL